MEALEKFFKERFRLTDDEWQLISERITLKTLEKKEFFIEQGKHSKNSGFLLEGIVRYFSYDKDGNDPTCYFSHETHYVIDPFGFRKRELSTINAQAITKCKIAVISFEHDKELLTVFPRWLDITNQILLDIGMYFANQKEMLSMNASTRYDYFIEKFPEVAKRVPLQYVASYLGIKQQSLSRVRKKNTAG